MNLLPRSPRCWLILVLLLLTAAAEGQPASLPPSAPPLPALGLSLLRVLGALTLVVGLFLGGVWCFRSWQRLAWQKGRTPKLNLLEVRPLGPRQALYLVACEQQRLLLGSSPAGLQLLAQWPQAPEPSLLAPLPAFEQELERAAVVPP